MHSKNFTLMARIESKCQQKLSDRYDLFFNILLTDTVRFSQITSEAEILDSFHSFSVSLLGLCGSTQLHLKRQNSVFCEISSIL